MSETPATPQKERSLRRRPWLIAGVIVIMLLGALVYFFLRDEVPPEDADFKPAWTAGGGPRNPLVIFMEETSPLYRREYYGHYQPGTPEEAQRLEVLVAKNAFVFPAFEKLMATDSSLWRWPDDRGTSFPLRDDCYICQEVAEIALATKVEFLVHHGQRREAAMLAVAMHRFGHGLNQAEGGSLYYSQVLKIQEVARDELVLALESETSPEILEQVQEELTGIEQQTSDLIPVIKRGHLLMTSVFHTMAHDEAAFADLTQRHPSYFKIWLRPNRTLWLDLQYRRDLIASLESGDWRKAHTQSEAFLDAVFARHRKFWHWMTNPNAFGRGQWYEWLNKDLVLDTATEVNKHRMLITSLAIRRYELSHNTLPKTLQDLVPEFLPAVPVDAMNSLSIEWDPAKRVLLARGFRSPGSIVIHRSWDGDITFPLWWKAP
ncbi:hypothetical protein [Roseimicrobium sp. ORNL1]|uniref:hypothetical protein n=1 Tax=Roseimicrobium sp. ORNL1 TaxID=2711231 RepID=UPI0013E10EF9|nr:hypothetical protein [Roseimicrobium sp. ORNL1]QIF04280.1 hypothetical protein G5S37_23065 [Roseimicrobium sp. ORNL1]